MVGATQMNLFNVLALLLTLAALASYLNDRYLRLPTTVGLMLMSVAGSLLLVAAEHFGLPLKASVERFVTRIDFSQTLLGGTLSFLLFAGALQIEWDQLREQRWRIPFLAVGTTALSTLLVAGFAWLIFHAMGMTLPLIYCLLFGAIISPTDPIAVVDMLKRAGASPSLSTKMAGESPLQRRHRHRALPALFQIAGGGRHGRAPWIGRAPGLCCCAKRAEGSPWACCWAGSLIS